MRSCWGGRCRPCRSYLLSDGNVTHNLSLFGSDGLHNAGESFLELVQVDEGRTELVSNEFLDVALDAGSNQGDGSELCIVAGSRTETRTILVDVAVAVGNIDCEDGLLAILTALENQSCGTILLDVA